MGFFFPPLYLQILHPTVPWTIEIQDGGLLLLFPLPWCQCRDWFAFRPSCRGRRAVAVLPDLSGVRWGHLACHGNLLPAAQPGRMEAERDRCFSDPLLTPEMLLGVQPHQATFLMQLACHTQQGEQSLIPGAGTG